MAGYSFSFALVSINYVEQNLSQLGILRMVEHDNYYQNLQS